MLPGVIGTLQATEVLKLLLGIGEPLIGRLLVYDALPARFRELRFDRDPECPTCGSRAREQAAGGADLTDFAASCAATTPPPPAASTGFEPSRLGVLPEQVRDRLAHGEVVTWLDVREPFEARICRIGESILIPLGDLPRHFASLPEDRPIIAYCHVGARSTAAVRFLRERGRSAWSLIGGIDAWARRIEPGMKTY